MGDCATNPKATTTVRIAFHVFQRIYVGDVSTVEKESQYMILRSVYGTQYVQLFAVGHKGILNLHNAQVNFNNLASKAGQSGSWLQLYINPANGEVRTQ